MQLIIDPATNGGYIVSNVTTAEKFITPTLADLVTLIQDKLADTDPEA